MNFSIEAATSMRDGAIDATAALNDALGEALLHTSDHDQEELKRVVGKAIAEIFTSLLHPAIQAYPELAIDEKAWAAVLPSEIGDWSNTLNLIIEYTSQS